MGRSPMWRPPRCEPELCTFEFACLGADLFTPADGTGWYTPLDRDPRPRQPVDRADPGSVGHVWGQLAGARPAHLHLRRRGSGQHEVPARGADDRRRRAGREHSVGVLRWHRLDPNSRHDGAAERRGLQRVRNSVAVRRATGSCSLSTAAWARASSSRRSPCSGVCNHHGARILDTECDDATWRGAESRDGDRQFQDSPIEQVIQRGDRGIPTCTSYPLHSVVRLIPSNFAARTLLHFDRSRVLRTVELAATRSLRRGAN